MHFWSTNFSTVKAAKGKIERERLPHKVQNLNKIWITICTKKEEAFVPTHEKRPISQRRWTKPEISSDQPTVLHGWTKGKEGLIRFKEEEKEVSDKPSWDFRWWVYCLQQQELLHTGWTVQHGSAMMKTNHITQIKIIKKKIIFKCKSRS